MRNIPFVSFALAILAVPLASAQSLVESATAAAGGSAAGMAGKTVSEGIDSVFSKVAGAAGSSASQGRKSGRIAPAVPPIPSVRLDAHQGELSGAKILRGHPTGGQASPVAGGRCTRTPGEFHRAYLPGGRASRSIGAHVAGPAIALSRRVARTGLQQTWPARLAHLHVER